MALIPFSIRPLGLLQRNIRLGTLALSPVVVGQQRNNARTVVVEDAAQQIAAVSQSRSNDLRKPELLSAENCDNSDF